MKKNIQMVVLVLPVAFLCMSGVVWARDVGGVPDVGTVQQTQTGGQNTQTQTGGQNTQVQTGGQNTQTQTGGQNTQVQTGNNQIPNVGTQLMNPLGNTAIEGFFLKIIQILIIFAVPIIVLFIILAGFKYVTARGNTEKISQATSALTWALVGGVIILGAEIILKVIQGTVNAIR